MGHQTLGVYGGDDPAVGVSAPDESTSSPDSDIVVAHCGACCRGFGRRAWQRLPLVGYQEDGAGKVLELRNCTCSPGGYHTRAAVLDREGNYLPDDTFEP